VSGFFLVFVIPTWSMLMGVRVVGMATIRCVSGVMLVKLAGSVGALELMAFARDAKQADGHEKHRKRFHRRAS